MIREVDLVLYLPAFMQKYKETVAALKAEELELNVVWENVHKIFYNHFISTADDYGVSRFEKMLGITPNADDTLEFRKAVIKSKWCSQIPYTEKGVKDKLKILCGSEDNFIYEYKEYLLKIKIALVKKNMVNEVLNILYQIIPENICIQVELLYNTHEIISDYRHRDLAKYTYGQLRDEVLN